MKTLFANVTLSIALMTTMVTAAEMPQVGDRRVEYPLTADVESAYRLFVPEDWQPGQHWPLVVILHGGGGNENTPFDRDPAFREQLQAAARAHHFILVSPRGLKGWWGAQMLPPDAKGAIGRGTYRMPPAGKITGPPPALSLLSAEERALSRKSVEMAIGAVQKAYGTDPHRLFLMGNSMGSVGTLHLAQEDPRRWCAIAPSDGPVDPATFPFKRVRGLNAAFFIHGDEDHVAPIESMTEIVNGFRRAGVPTDYLIVKGGTHGDSWHQALDPIFTFFANSKCGPVPPKSKD